MKTIVIILGGIFVTLLVLLMLIQSVPLHPEANLSSTEKATLIGGLETTLLNDPPIED